MRALVAVLLLAAAFPAAAQRIPIRLEWLTPRQITVHTRQADAPPIRLRAVRADTGLPQAGVEVYLMVGVIECAPLFDCQPPPVSFYGRWEGAGGEDDYSARGVSVFSDAQGVVAAPRLIGGAAPWWYFIQASVGGYDTPYTGVYGQVVELRVNQLRAAPRPVPASPFALLALAVLLTVSARAWRRAG